MSNFNFKAENIETGDIVTVQAMDDYFGKHIYGYQVGKHVYEEDEFNELFITLE